MSGNYVNSEDSSVSGRSQPLSGAAAKKDPGLAAVINRQMSRAAPKPASQGYTEHVWTRQLNQSRDLFLLSFAANDPEYDSPELDEAA